MASETYLTVVWRQFRANRPAYISLWMLAPLFLGAIFAPLIASNLPLIYRDGAKWSSPWWHGLFNPDEPVDFFFNMALLAFLPTFVIALIANLSWRRRRMSGRRRVQKIIYLYLCLTVLSMAIFSVRTNRPLDRNRQRTFAEEEYLGGGEKRGWYTPIPFGPIEQDLDAVFKRPMFRQELAKCKESNDRFPHILGTDSNGRDVLTQMIYGTRISMTVGLLAVSLYVSIGSLIGALAGYFGGAVDVVISRIIEIVLLFPSFFLILTLVALVGPSIYIIMFVIGITGWPTIARLVRAEVLKQRSLDYVAAARALGATHWRIIFRHVFPNSLSPALVAAPFGVAGAIITEAGLSLLGFGVRPPTPSWGVLLSQGSGNYNYWWLVVVPSLAIFATVTIFNLVGSGLRDAMDPKLRGQS